MTTLIDPITGDTVTDVLANLPTDVLVQKCLDHGFVKILDVMPRLVPAVATPNCDFSLADAARISYQRGTRKISADNGLIDHLTRNEHTSPIEMGELKFHIRLPIFVMRQHVRHRMASLNEESARYSELASDFYIPDPKDWAMNTAANKQATVKYTITPEIAKRLHEWIREHNDDAYDLYQSLLNGQEDLPGNMLAPPIAREQARMVLGVNIYTQCVWKIDLKNLLHYLRLRTDKHAQYEIRVFADAIARVTSYLFPSAYGSFKDHFMDGVNLALSERELLACMLAGDEETYERLRAFGWSRTRWQEFLDKKVKRLGFIHFDFHRLESVANRVWAKDGVQ